MRSKRVAVASVAVIAAFATVPLRAVTDATPPVLVNFEALPAAVDVTTTGQTIKIRAHITDDVEFRDGTFWFRSPTLNQQVAQGFSAFYRISGTAQDGVYETQVLIPKAAEPGNWALCGVTLNDVAGNQIIHDPYHEAFPAGITTAVAVTSTSPDWDSPYLLGFAFTPTTANVGDAAKTIAITLRFADSYTGVHAGGLRFRSPSGTATLDAGFGSWTRTSGTAQDGVYRTEVTVPKLAEEGIWTLDFVYAYDEVNNYRTYGPYYRNAYPDGTPTELVIAAPAQFSAAAYAIGEGDTAATVTIVRGGAGSGEAMVHYTTADGTALAGQDYTAVAGDLVFAVGELSKDISIPLLSDTSYEGNETFSVALSSPVGVTLGLPASTVVTIADSSAPPKIQFAAQTYSVNESGGSLTVTLKKTGATAAAAAVHYATSDGTAVRDKDYGAIEGNIFFAASETSKTITVPILQDNIDEPAEYFWLKLSGASGATLPQPDALTTIVDDDPLPAAHWTAATSSVRERAGQVLLTVKLNGRKSTPATVHFATHDGTALAGSDYRATSGDITFQPGGSSTHTVAIPIIDDKKAERSQSFTVTLAPPSSAAVGKRSKVTVTITDKDTATASAREVTKPDLSAAPDSAIAPLLSAGEQTTSGSY